MSFVTRLLLLLWAGLLAFPALAQPKPVDTALVLLVDVSASIDDNEYRLQRQGYADAFRSPDVLRAIRQSGYGQIAVTMIEWSSQGMSKTVLPWMMISSTEEAEQAAIAIETNIRHTSNQTSISWALSLASEAIDDLPFQAERIVVDVSGDGVNNDGPLPDVMRDSLLARGVTINGILIKANTKEPIVEHYSQHVIGGIGHFHMEINSFDQFPEAIRRKIVVELG